MNILTFKIISIFSVFTVGVIGGVFSFVLAESKNSRKLFSLGNAFAAGVFLAAGLIHMLPDAHEGFSKLSNFPWAYLGCSLGFVFIFFLERVVLQGHHGVSDSVSKHGNEHKLSLRLIVLTAILSIHSVIAGTALGTELNLTHSAVILFAILAHKGSAAFALAINFLKENIPKRVVSRTIAFFCFMTPAGIVLGMLINHVLSGVTQQIVTASFDAVAAGTFLYVSILGIAHEEFVDQENKFLKFTLMCVGITIMTLVAIWT